MKRVILRFGEWLTSVGERTGIRVLVYNPIIWSHYLISARRCGAVFSKAVHEQFPGIRTSQDVGAGTGGYVFRLKQGGVDATGVEYSPMGRWLASLQGVELKEFDCAAPNALSNTGSFDLVYSIEVAEHIPEQLSNNFVECMIGRSDLVIFSAAVPGQGGHGHINEQDQSYWREKFEARGYAYRQEESQRFSSRLQELGFRGWLPYNVQVFRRDPARA